MAKQLTAKQKRKITVDKQNTVIKYIHDRLSNRKIQHITRVSKSTVSRIRQDHCTGAKSTGSGRQRALTEQNELFCMYQITVGGKETATEVQQSLKEDLKVDVSAATIRRVFKKYGLEAIVKQKKPLITEANRRKRLAWAKAHIKCTLDDWKRVVFSDETKICRFGSDGKHYAWKREGEPLLRKHGGGDIKLWSCVTYAGVGYITKIEDTMTKEVYLEILKDDLYQTLDDYRIEPAKVIFQQDNDPKHRANLVEEWLFEQPFEVMQWPPQSPDLNPIENIWALLKSRLYRNYERPLKGMNEHWERVYKTWYDITAEECQRYINTMHQRCRDVIKAKGLWINY